MRENPPDNVRPFFSGSEQSDMAQSAFFIEPETSVDIESAIKTLSKLCEQGVIRAGGAGGTVSLLDFPAFQKMKQAANEQIKSESAKGQSDQSEKEDELPPVSEFDLYDIMDGIEERMSEEKYRKRSEPNSKPPVPPDPYNLKINKPARFSASGLAVVPEPEEISFRSDEF